MEIVTVVVGLREGQEVEEAETVRDVVVDGHGEIEEEKERVGEWVPELVEDRQVEAVVVEDGLTEGDPDTVKVALKVLIIDPVGDTVTDRDWVRDGDTVRVTVVVGVLLLHCVYVADGEWVLECVELMVGVVV